MFIKKTYEDRIKREEQLENEGLFQKKPQLHKIGSIKNQKVNYHVDEQFFSPDDVPLNAMESKKYIQQKIDPDLLGLRPKQWNNSTSVPVNPLLEETHERKLIKIKLGLFDQPQPVAKEKFVEQGTDSRNDYTGWNVSTQLEQKELNSNLLNYTNYVKNRNRQKEGQYLTGYVNPTEGQKLLNDNLRQVKEIEKEYRQKLKDEYQAENRTASDQNVNAVVFRLTYEQQLKQKQITQDPGLTFKPKILNKNQGKYIAAEHSGIYELKTVMEKDDEGNKVPVQIGAWSCCLAEEKDAPGCSKQIKDQNRWNYASYNIE